MGVEQQSPAETPKRRRSRFKRVAAGTAGLVTVYLLTAYVLMPVLWKRYEKRHPYLEAIPRITHTADGIPGDPLNVALVGSEEELKQIMHAAGWFKASPLGPRSDFDIALDSVFKRPDPHAPVSSLYLFGRRQDLAFEQPVGDSPRHRHHVRFWRARVEWEDGRPLWVGSAVYDERVGISLTTWQITHVTAADVDAERDKLFRDLERTGELARVEVIDDFHQVRHGRNGGGDPWHTDGALDLGVIVERKTR